MYTLAAPGFFRYVNAIAMKSHQSRAALRLVPNELCKVGSPMSVAIEEITQAEGWQMGEDAKPATMIDISNTARKVPAR